MSIDWAALTSRALANLEKLAEVPMGELQQQASQLPGQVPPPQQPGQPQIDPATGQAIDPNTGLPMMPVDPNTGMPIDPATGQPIDPAAAQQAQPEDPTIAINEKLDSILKVVSQIRTVVSTIADMSGIQIPTSEALSAGEDAVAEHATATKQPAAKTAGDDAYYGDDSGIQLSSIADQLEDYDTPEPTSQAVSNNINKHASSIMKRFAR